MDVRLVIPAPTGPGRSIVKKLPILVGRSEEARLRIRQDCVSRRHCEIVERGGDVFVRDLASTNGTVVDGVEIDRDVDVPLPSGATVTVGGASFRVEYGSGGTTVAVSAAAGPGDEQETVPLAGAAVTGDDADADGQPAWPVASEPAATSEGDLDDFFKSLS